MTKNFTLAEFTHSATAERLGIDNTPSAAAIDNLRHLCQALLQPFRDHLRCPVVINSGYRSTALNRAVGGVPRSQHLTGEAADIRLPRIPGTKRVDLRLARDWMSFIANNLPFDQLILEHNAQGAYWLHVSIRRDASRNRRQVLELLKE